MINGGNFVSLIVCVLKTALFDQRITEAKPSLFVVRVIGDQLAVDTLGLGVVPSPRFNRSLLHQDRKSVV